MWGWKSCFVLNEKWEFSLFFLLAYENDVTLLTQWANCKISLFSIIIIIIIHSLGPKRVCCIYSSHVHRIAWNSYGIELSVAFNVSSSYQTEFDQSYLFKNQSILWADNYQILLRSFFFQFDSIPILLFNLRGKKTTFQCPTSIAQCKQLFTPIIFVYEMVCEREFISVSC